MHSASHCILSKFDLFQTPPARAVSAEADSLHEPPQPANLSVKQSPFDLLFEHLKKKGLIDDQGFLRNLDNFHLPPLGISQMERLKDLLASPFKIVSNDGSFQFDIKLGSLLEFLNSKGSIAKIANIEIVGGTVFWLLGLDYSLKVLGLLGVNDVGQIVPLETLKEGFQEPPDIDIRINVPKATPYQLKQFRDELIKYLSEKLPADANNKGNLIYEKCFLKFKPMNDGSNCFFIAAFGNRDVKVIDLLFVSHLKRDHLFIHDAIRLNISPLIKNTSCVDGFLSIVPQGNFQNGTSSIIHRLCKILNAINIEDIDLSGTHMLLSYYTKGWRTFNPELEKILSQKIVKAISNSDGTSAQILELKKIIQNHFPNDPSAISCMVFNTLQMLQKIGCGKQIKMVLEGLAPLFKPHESILNENSNELIFIMLMLINGKVEFEEVASFLQIQTFISLCAHNQSEEGPALFLVKNGKNQAVHFSPFPKGHSYTLQLPYEPVNAVRMISKVSRSLSNNKKKDILHAWKLITRLIFPEDLTSIRYKCHAEMPQEIAEPLKIAQEEANVLMVHPENGFVNIGMSLALENLKNFPVDNTLMQLVTKLPVILLFETNSNRRDYFLNTYVFALQRSNLAKYLPLQWHSLNELTILLRQNPLTEQSLNYSLCLAFSKIRHPTFAFFAQTLWKDTRSKMICEEYAALSLKLIFDGFLPENKTFAVGVFNDLITNAAATSSGLWSSFNKMCEYIKSSPNNNENTQTLHLLARSSKLLLKKTTMETHSNNPFDTTNLSWLIKSLSENSIIESIEILRTATNRKTVRLPHDTISELWLDCANTVLDKLGVSEALKVWSEAQAIFKDCSKTELDKWIDFEFKLLNRLNSQAPFENIEEQVVISLSSKTLTEDSKKMFNAFVCGRFDQLLEKCDIEGLQECLGNHRSMWLSSSQKLNYYHNVLQKQLSSGTSRGCYENAWKTIEAMASICTSVQQNVSDVDTSLKQSAIDRAFVIRQSEEFIKIVLSSTLVGKYDVSLNFIKQTFTTNCFIDVYKDNPSSRLSLIGFWCDESLKNPEKVPNPSFQNCFKLLNECTSENDAEAILKSTIAWHAARVCLHLRLHSHSGKHLLLQNYTWIIPNLRLASEQRTGGHLDILCNLFRVLQDCNIPFQENPEILTVFWWVVFSILARQPFHENDADLANEVLDHLSKKSKSKPNSKEIEALAILSRNYLSINRPLKACKTLERLLHDNDLQNSDRAFLEPSLSCIKTLISLKELTKAMNLLKQVEILFPDLDTTITMNLWLDIVKESESISPWVGVNILLDKAILLSPISTANMYAQEFLKNLKPNSKNASSCLQSLLLLQNYQIADARLWRKWVLAALLSSDSSLVNKSIDLILNFAEPLGYLKASPSERMKCWGELLKCLAQKHSGSIKPILEKHEELLAIINSFEDDTQKNEALYNLMLAYLRSLQDLELRNLYSGKIIKLLEKIHARNSLNLNQTQSNELDLAFLEAYIDTEDPEIFMVATDMLMKYLISPLNQTNTDQLINICNKAAQQIIRFKNHPSTDIYTRVLSVKVIICTRLKEKIKLLPFVDAFIKHPSPLLHHEAYMLAQEIITECPLDKRLGLSSEYKAASPIIKYLLIKMISDMHLENVIKIMNMLQMTKHKGFLSTSDCSTLWGQLILMHLNTAKKEDSLELICHSLEFFFLYNEFTRDNKEMEKRCLECATDALLSLSFQFKETNLFNNHFVLFCQYFLGTTNEEVNNAKGIFFDFFLTFPPEIANSQTTQWSSKELKLSYLTQDQFMKNIESLCDKNAPAWLSMLSKIKDKKQQQERDRFYNFMHIFVKQINMHRSELPMDQAFLLGNACIHFDMLNRLFHPKSNELAELFHLFAFRYLPSQPGIFEKQIRAVVHLFKTSQQRVIHKSSPEKVFELILLMDMNLCAQPALSKNQQAHSIHNVISLLTNSQSIPMLWRALFIMERVQYLLQAEYSNILKKCYEDLFKAVKQHPFHSIEEITLLEQLKLTLVNNDASYKNSTHTRINESYILQLVDFFKLVLDLKPQFKSPLDCAKFLDGFLTSIRTKPYLLEKECTVLDMVESMWPLSLEPLSAPSTQIIFDQYKFLMEANEHNKTFCKVIAISFNRWVLELKLNKQVFAPTLAQEIFKKALANNFYTHAPDDFQTIWELLKLT